LLAGGDRGGHVEEGRKVGIGGDRPRTDHEQGGEDESVPEEFIGEGRTGRDGGSELPGSFAPGAGKELPTASHKPCCAECDALGDISSRRGDAENNMKPNANKLLNTKHYLIITNAGIYIYTKWSKYFFSRRKWRRVGNNIERWPHDGVDIDHGMVTN
jgi:hypothetical protein